MDNKKAAIATSAGTAVVLAAKTAALKGPVANLGGYATAQMLAAGTGLAGKGLSVAIATVGGPVVAGAGFCALIGGATFGILSIFKK